MEVIMETKKIIAKELKAFNGFAALFLIILFALVATAMVIVGAMGLDGLVLGSTALGVVMFVFGLLLVFVLCFVPAGLKVVRPNEARVFTLFGKYYGTISKSGFFFVNPFVVSIIPADDAAKEAAAAAAASKAKLRGNETEFATQSMRKVVSLKTQTLSNSTQKVNDVLGNPIMIGAIVIWKVVDPTQAVFAVENYKEYLSIQTDSIVRNTARLYPYDVFDEDEDDGKKEYSLRGSSLEIAENMKKELQERVESAGLYIEEVRITHLAYAEEIAAAMLQRQQAAAIIAARQKIVDGAVGMVKMALEKLSEDDIVVLDDERKAAMVSNLLVVLCGNKDAQPIVNSGTLYS